MFNGKKIVVFGGAGSVGSELVLALARERSMWDGRAVRVLVSSRDEHKHHNLQCQLATTQQQVQFTLGDVRDYVQVQQAVRGADFIVCAEALKHIQQCEANPIEAIRTNVMGTNNIISALQVVNPAARVLFLSTDKAAGPVGVYGMTKYLQERLFQASPLNYVGIRFGNIVPSSGSAIPMFKRLAEECKDIPLTDDGMTRFFISMKDATQILIRTLLFGTTHTITIPRMASARIGALVDIYRERYKVGVVCVGPRPGERKDELLATDEEIDLCVPLGDRWELYRQSDAGALRLTGSPPIRRNKTEFSSDQCLMSKGEMVKFLLDCGQL